MNKYDNYKYCLKKEADNVMEHEMTDLKSLEYLHCLFDMIGHMKEKSKEYEEKHLSNDIESDMMIDKKMDKISEHLKDYKQHKDEYRNTKDVRHKEMMFNELKMVFNEIEKTINDVLECGFDCQEEKVFIKEFLQKIYRKVS